MYNPSSSNDAENITERVTARLSHANSAVVLAAIKVVLKCMDYIDNQEVCRTLAKKLNPPLVTLLSSEPEIQYVALRNIRLIVQKRPGILAADVKMFFCKYNDPVYVKLEKVDLMVMLVSERNVEQVLLELKEYSSGVDVDFVRKSVRSIGRVAVKLERACERAITVLLELIETKVNYVVQEATVVIKDIFRKYPSRYEQVLSALCDSLDALDEPEAKASMIWILGEYAERIDNVDDILDAFLQNFQDEPAIVQQQLLTAIVKLFLKKPVSTQDMVSKALRCATEESTNHDLRDRGYIYWRLLSTNPEATKHVVLGDKPTIRDESQVLEKTLLEKLIADLALMSSVYHKPREEFITRINTSSQPEEATVEDDEEVDEEDRAETRRKVKEEMETGGGKNGTTRESPVGTAGGAALDLLDLDGGGDDIPAPVVAVQKVQVLPPTQAGQGGKAGCGIMAALARQGGGIQLLMTFTNSTQMVMNGFAIQVNKNPFGLSPAAALQVPDLMPGSSQDAVLTMTPNVLLSGSPPTNPLILQVAIKNSLDIFYFNVPFDLPVVFVPDAPVQKDPFTQVWQKVGESQQLYIQGQVASPLTADGLRNLLQADSIGYVAQRQKDEETTYVYVAATLTNKVPVLAEVALFRSSTALEVKIRTDGPPVVSEVFQACLIKRLGLRQ
jgi:AP-1 complex subunit beta-1